LPGFAVTGGYVYRGTHIPELSGVYLYDDCGSGRIWGAFRDEAGRWTSVDLLDTPYAISTFGEDQAWESYLTDHALTTGTIFRIVGSH
jgi:hypothetical protein